MRRSRLHVTHASQQARDSRSIDALKPTKEGGTEKQSLLGK